MNDVTDVRYPNITVQLTGEDGNAYSILGRVRKEMRKSGVSDNEINKFLDEATQGNYDHLLRTCMKWVNTN